MTPREVDELSHDEYMALWRYAEEETRRSERELRKARKGRR